ncbi:uncharacterized protein [Henckelia pumila]|uniref:uncharacterized protein n=1 Tax=Henckelia pumila TaxID=405737 RepID=UPI003C6DC9A2
MKLSKLLGADVGINYKTEDFSKRVKAETKGKGVDIILDGSGIEHFQKNLDCLARGGSLVVLGAKVGGLVDIDLSVLMKKDITIIGVDMQNLSFANRHRLLSDAVAKFWPLIEAGYIKPIIGKIFTFTEAVKEHIEPWRRIVFQENCC